MVESLLQFIPSLIFCLTNSRNSKISVIHHPVPSLHLLTLTMKGSNSLILLTVAITVDAYVVLSPTTSSVGVRAAPSLNRNPLRSQLKSGHLYHGSTQHHRSPFQLQYQIQCKQMTSSKTQLAAKNDEPDEETEAEKGSSIPNKIVTLWKLLITKLMSVFPALRVALASFTVGAIFGLTLIFVPVLNSVDKLSEPVTLFETILSVSVCFCESMVSLSPPFSHDSYYFFCYCTGFGSRLCGQCRHKKTF